MKKSYWPFMIVLALLQGGLAQQYQVIYPALSPGNYARNAAGAVYFGDSSTGTGRVVELVRDETGTWNSTIVHQFDFPEYGVGSGTVDTAGNVFGAVGLYTGGEDIFELSKDDAGNWNYTVIATLQNYVGEFAVDAVGNLFNQDYSPFNIFELSLIDGVWTQSILYSLDAFSGYSPLAVDSQNNLYYTRTQSSGEARCISVHRFDVTAGTDQVLHDIPCGHGLNFDIGSLAIDASGNLFGTTYDQGKSHLGTVYEVSPAAGGGWTAKVIHNFQGGLDGSHPTYGVIVDAAGNLYGTTYGGGGAGTCLNGPRNLYCGTVFKLSNVDGVWSETILHAFSSDEGQGHPKNNLVVEDDGTIIGGAEGKCCASLGVTFALTP